MKKVAIVAISAGLATSWCLGIGVFVAAQVNAANSDLVELGVPRVSPKPTQAPTSPPTPVATVIPVTPEPAPPVVEQAPVVPQQPQQQVVQEVAPAPAPEMIVVEESSMTRHWTDAAGNQYIGPNAISCADGAPPIQPPFGFPAMCATQIEMEPAQ